MALDFELAEAGGKRIAVCDSETDPFKLGRSDIKPFVWGWFNGDEYHYFDTTELLVAHIRDRDEILYAHNGGKFDWHFLLPFADPMQPLGIISGRIARMRIGKCELRDSYNILPTSLASWGGQHKKTEIDYAIMERDARDIPENRLKILAYLEDDCRALFDMVSKFIAEYGLHLTVAGTAMATWQAMVDCEAPQSTEAFYNELHPYYYGGRVQCFRTGVGECAFQVIDINSAYPRAMMEHHPLRPEASTYTRGTSLAGVLLYIERRGAGLVFASVRAVSRGAFPWRSEDGALYFPDDDQVRVFHVTGWELLAGLETRTVDILQVVSMTVFDSKVEFSQYVNHFYNLRMIAKRDGDAGRDLFAKLLLTNLYGKFAANPDEYRNYINVPPRFAGVMTAIPKRLAGSFASEDAADIRKYQFAGMLGPWALGAKPLELHERRYYNIATAASITGWVRAYLWRALHKCGGLIYCDTDSIAAESFGEGIPFGDALGEWKVEGDFQRFAVGGRKLYAFNYQDGYVDSKGRSMTGRWKTASKGVRLAPEQVMRIAAGEEVTFENDKPTFSIHHAPRIVNRTIRAVHRTVPEK